MTSADQQNGPEGSALRRGWTTGACASAAVKSAMARLVGGDFEDPVTVTLPGGQTPAFVLTHEASGPDWAEAAIIKDAGDDPDVTHGATIIARVVRAEPGSGISFHAGSGVGTFTKPGLPLPVGEAAINPVPRRMMVDIVNQICATHKITPDIAITISVPKGEEIAQKTWNPRLGILGGISILGTTGIVIPYSCSAWIHSIHRGIDVARAIGLTHVVGSTGDASEKAAMKALDLPMEAYLDMGDFVGGLLKYLKKNPVPHVTIAGGFAKLSKLAEGALDLHSARSSINLDHLADSLKVLGADDEIIAQARAANTASEVLQLANSHNFPLADVIADAARWQAMQVLKDSGIEVGILITDRAGTIVARAG